MIIKYNNILKIILNNYKHLLSTDTYKLKINLNVDFVPIPILIIFRRNILYK